MINDLNFFKMNENSNLNLANRYGGLVRGEGGCNDITTLPPNQT